MSRFRKLTHTIWHCKYHIVWRPKYRLRILEGRIADDVQKCTRAFTVHQGCEVDELNIQLDHVHFIAIVPPKISISQFVGTVKGRTAIRRGASRGRPFFVQWTRSGRIGGFVGKGRHKASPYSNIDVGGVMGGKSFDTYGFVNTVKPNAGPG